MKVCSLCNIEKSLVEFTNDRNGRLGLKSACRCCLTAQKKAARRRNPIPSREACKRWKMKNPEKRLACEKKYRAALPAGVLRARYDRWAAKNPERVLFLSRKSLLKRKYGMTPDDFDRMVVGQSGVCALCKRVPTGKKGLVVDHDHKTGRVRGLLCSLCNWMLGCSQDSPEVLRRAADYLHETSRA